MSESDGIDAAVEGITRVGLTVAGRLGKQLSREREQTLRRVQVAEEQQARELQARFDAERAAARAQIAPALNDRWWDTATGRDIERVHETATAWKDHDPAARDAAQTIKDQIQRRYGLDVNNLGVDEAPVATALAKAGRDREQADKEDSTGRGENAQAAGLLAEAERDDRDRQQDVTEENQHLEALHDEAGIKYDSAERGQELAASLDGIANKEAVQARLVADQDQGTPPSAVIASALRRSPKARKTRGANRPTKLVQKSLGR
ncbi:hypothetical protein [Paenarthrobacter nicotinovorans]|uniref:hypothetical protein n=1 Tax=Paenarthrobacter nicotinovorans TaxID=29320 RepID=UPI003A80D162